MFKQDWIMSWILVDYSPLNNVHDWENLCIQLIYQQTVTPNNYNLIEKFMIFNPIFVDASSEIC